MEACPEWNRLQLDNCLALVICALHSGQQDMASQDERARPGWPYRALTLSRGRSHFFVALALLLDKNLGTSLSIWALFRS